MVLSDPNEVYSERLGLLWRCVENAHDGGMSEAQALWLTHNPGMASFFLAVMEMDEDGTPRQ
jgi:hypothetical protein